MKQTITTVAIVATIVTILAFVNADNKSEGAIGDVKYSVLPPDKFKEENGNGWVLMDDKVPITNSDLESKHGIKEIPDARGLFIRSLNGTRNDDKADPYLKENNKARLMGDYQMDAVGKHTHPINMRTGYMLALGAVGVVQEASIFVGDRPAWGHPNGYGGLTATDNQLPITESRPKNISLYTYIKINEK